MQVRFISYIQPTSLTPPTHATIDTILPCITKPRLASPVFHIMPALRGPESLAVLPPPRTSTSLVVLRLDVETEDSRSELTAGGPEGSLAPRTAIAYDPGAREAPTMPGALTGGLLPSATAPWPGDVVLGTWPLLADPPPDWCCLRYCSSTSRGYLSAHPFPVHTVGFSHRYLRSRLREMRSRDVMPGRLLCLVGWVQVVR